MRDYKLLSFDMSNLSTLYQLWKDHLYKDDQWHFFWEGEYTALRISEDSALPVIHFLSANDIKFIDQGPWIDNIKITQKYQKEFAPIFHSFSELAMKNVNSKDDEIDQLIDRVIHCFMNNLMTKTRTEKEGIFWEPLLIAKSAIFRSITIGQIARIIHDDK